MKWAWTALRDDRGKRLATTHCGNGVVAVVLSLVAIALAVGFVSIVSEGPPVRSLVVAAYGLMILAALVVVIVKSVGPDPVVEEAKGRGVCASCRYSLAGCQAEPDGCTVCPECGAAWRLQGESSKTAKQQSSK